MKMDIKNEAHFLKNIERTPSFIVYQKKGGNFWNVDVMLETPLGEKDGYPDFKDLNE